MTAKPELTSKTDDFRHHFRLADIARNPSNVKSNA
jgi:hypothetical protein